MGPGTGPAHLRKGVAFHSNADPRENVGQPMGLAAALPFLQPDIETTALEQRFEEDKDLEVSADENENEDATAA